VAEITVDPALCRKDGLCAMACARGIFRQEESGGTPEVVRADTCFHCGHCVAICPSGAISHSDFPDGSVTSIKPEWTPSYDQVLQLIRNRRSKRLFKSTPVEREVIEQVIEAARFAPSGHNARGTEYIVVQDRDTLREVGKLTADGLRKMAKPFRSPVGRAAMRFVLGRRQTEVFAGFAPELEHLASVFDSGDDKLLNNAPVLVIFHADEVGGFASVDASLALQNAALAAEALGLGCFYVGFVVMACGRDDRIPKLLSLPEHHKVFGGLAMGYPRLSFGKWPERKPAKITWV